ncbi:hypothetical protein A4X03_0g2382 [Tilletia caries]|uniref:Nucleoporin Nup188 N-terminal subdomain III domain-containing protein n=1 Tax=Tilletia caries TaxID=13290 RepID=A0A177V925_9BASI|nr:hypothetical protein A4X03_0g2382 [Tilletia caries]
MVLGDSHAEARLTYADLAHALQDPGADLPLDALSKALSTRIAHFQKCGEQDPSPSSQAKSKLDASNSLTQDDHDGKAINITPTIKALAADFSNKLVLDQVQTALLLTTYIHAHAITNLEALTEQQKDELCDRLTEFHFEERLATIHCVQTLFLIAETEGHAFQDGALQILAKIMNVGFGARCIRTFTASTKRQLPSHVREVIGYASFWATQQLKEQLALLELAFTFFRNRPSLPENVAAVVDACKETGIGRVQANQGFFPVKSTTLQQSIQFTLVLLMVITIDLDLYSGPIELASSASSRSSTSTSPTLADDPALLRKVIDFLDFGEPDLLQGPFMLAWALVIRAIEDALTAQREASGRNVVPEHLHDLEDALEREHLDPIWKKLSAMALDPDTALFYCLQQIAGSPLLAALPVHAGVALPPAAALHYRSTLKRLVLASVQLVRPEYLPDFEALVTVLETICSASASASSSPSSSTRIHPDLAAALPKLCLQFWLSDVEERQGGAILDTARRRWPVSFRPLLRLLQTFSGVTRLPTGGHAPPDATRAAAESLSSTISYFVNLSSLTFPLPANNPVYGAFWGVVSGGSDGSAVYEAIRPIPVLGRHVVPVGSQGVLISHEDSVQSIALWSLDQPKSGWVLLRDFLLALVPTPERSRTSAMVVRGSSQAHAVDVRVDDSAVFEQTAGGKALDFYALAPASSHDSMEVVVSDALDLFAVAMASPQTASALLEHLRSWDADVGGGGDGTVSLTDGHARASSSLSAIVISLLSNALQSDTSASRCISSAYQLLATLLPHESSTIWSLLRSADLIPPSRSNSAAGSSFRSVISSTHSCDRLLATEVRAGSFTGTLALLDFLSALSAELRANHLATPTETLEVQSTKLAECAQWVFSAVWTHFYGWTYRDPGERLLLAERCLSLFEAILDDPSLRLAESGAAALGMSVERLFVSGGADVHAIRPMFLLLNSGHAMLAAIDLADRDQLGTVERALTAALGFAASIIGRSQQREPETTTTTASPSLMVLSFFESGNISDRLGSGTTFVHESTASAVMAYAVADVSPLLSLAALQLLQSVVRAAAAISPASPELNFNLIAHLGSTSNMSALRARMAEILEHSHAVPVKRELWRLLAVIASSQPALAALLLANGRVVPGGTGSGSGAGKEKETEKATAEVGNATPLLSLAAREVGRWKNLFGGTPRLLEAVLQLLSSIWLQRSNLQSSIGAISEGEDLWKAVRELALFKTEPPPATASEIIVGPDGSWATDAHDSVARYCYQVTCKAAALDLFASEILYRCASSSPSSVVTPAIRVAQSKVTVFKEAVQIGQSSELVGALVDACTIVSQPERAERLQGLFKRSGLGVSLAGFWRPRPDEPFNQLYGDSFKYDGALLLDKLDGLAAEVGTPAEELRALLLELACVNNDLSTSTAQRVLLWGWTHFLDALTLHKTRLPWQATPAEQERTLLAAFVRCAEVTVSDTSVEGYMVDVNRKRMKLLRIILKAAWEGDADTDVEEGAVLRQDALANTVKVIELCQRLAEQGFAVVEAKDRYSWEVWASLHQDVLSLIGLCPPKILAGLKLISKLDDHSSREAGIVLGKAGETFRRRVLVALGGALQYGIDSMRSRTEIGSMVACQDDVALIGSVLCPLLALPGGSPALAQDLYETGVIGLVFDLIQRAPILSPTQTNGAFDVNGQGEVWLFAQPLLSLVLALSCRPGLPEALVHGGVMSALTANALTEALEAGAVQPSPSALVPRPLFDAWILMLRVVISLIDNLNGGEGWSSPSARFVEEEVLGFARLYHLQILSAFELSASAFGEASGTFVVGSRTSQRSEKICPGQLASIQAAAQFYYGLCRAVAPAYATGSMKRNSAMVILLSALTDRASILLQQTVYLLQHPLQVQALLQQEASARPSVEEATKVLRDVAGCIVSAFFTVTGPELLFVSDVPGPARRLVKPSLRTYPSEPASLGTLMDLSTHLIDSLRKPSRPAGTSSSAAEKAMHAGMLEQTLALCATQLVVMLSGISMPSSNGGTASASTALAAWNGGREDHAHDVDTVKKEADAAKREVEAGLGRDLKNAIKDAKAAVVGSGQCGEAGSGRFLDALAAFTSVRLAPFQEEDVDED